VNSILVFFGIVSWKPVLTALVMPPVPLLLLMLIGSRAILWRRGVGWLLVLLGASGLWVTSTTGFGDWFEHTALKPPPALKQDAIAELRKAGGTGRNKTVAIVVLGGGREALAPEYGISNLTATSLERLRYGIWLSRETGLPVAFSGGTGHAQPVGAPEAQIAARIAEQEFKLPLRWTETQSRDTLENAAYTVPMLREAGVTHVVLVTHGVHMRRALRDFEGAAQGNLKITPAPMGLAAGSDRPVLEWLPSGDGFAQSRAALHEGLGLLLGF